MPGKVAQQAQAEIAHQEEAWAAQPQPVVPQTSKNACLQTFVFEHTQNPYGDFVFCKKLQRLS